MAFLQHNPRRGARAQLLSSPSTTSLSPAVHSLRQSQSRSSKQENADDHRDWSIVFPGKTKVDDKYRSSSSSSSSPSPFILPPEEEGMDDSNVELALPHEQDGTGRFIRPSSPLYAADDEEDEEEEEEEDDRLEDREQDAERDEGNLDGVVLPSTDSPTSAISISEHDSELEGLEVASSAFFSESERGRRNSSVSRRQQRRLAEWEEGTTLSSSSWAWINAEESNRSLTRASQYTHLLPVVLTSGSEGEEDDIFQHVVGDEAAFEDALANTHTAQSAGLAVRAPKRRHRKNGESAKGSKRSNSSAVPNSELQAFRRRAATRARRSAAGSQFSARSASCARISAERSRVEEKGKSDAPRARSLLDAILQRLFNVEDDVVLQAFLRDEGPLRVDQAESTSHLAAESAAALKAVPSDDVWSRNDRNRQLRRTRFLQEDNLPVDEERDAVPKVLLKLPPRAMVASQIISSPPRIRVQSHVGEPTLLEALQATMLAGLSTVPSGLSMLLAGSRSARIVNYLAGRLGEQLGPSLTERMKKLIDDAEDDTTIADEVFGQKPRSPTRRFRGDSHPAISSRSSSTINTVTSQAASNA